jgi:hypothetical protein
MRKIILLALLFIPLISFSQPRMLKKQQPSAVQLMMFEIRLNPNDTVFNSVDFSYLPVKGYPFFTADPRKEFYTIQQRDSILRKLDELFFE